MKYYVVFMSVLDQKKSEKYRSEHQKYLVKMKAEGKVFAMGGFSDDTGGLIVYMAGSLDEVISNVQSDPFIISKARGYEIHEWNMVTDATINAK